MSNKIDLSLNAFEVLVVVDHYEKLGIKHFDLMKGNGCIWSARGSGSVPINEYFVFREGKLIDIQID